MIAADAVGMTVVMTDVMIIVVTTIAGKKFAETTTAVTNLGETIIAGMFTTLVLLTATTMRERMRDLIQFASHHPIPAEADPGPRTTADIMIDAKCKKRYLDIYVCGTVCQRCCM